jgi:hypothetical protein
LDAEKQLNKVEEAIKFLGNRGDLKFGFEGDGNGYGLFVVEGYDFRKERDVKFTVSNRDLGSNVEGFLRVVAKAKRGMGL